MNHSDADRYLTFPALMYLFITLVSGIWIRVQWIEPTWAIFSPKFAIHAHSHLAMLGWLFPIFLRLLLPKNQSFSVAEKTSVWVLHGLIIAMFPAFLFEGYAFWSILFSSLYLVVSYVIIYQFRAHLFSIKNPVVRIAVGFYLISTMGPWALGGATAFGPQWLNAWIAWFLHLQFNGWISFAVLSLLLNSDSNLRSVWILAATTTFLSLGFMFEIHSDLMQILLFLVGFVHVFTSGHLWISEIKRHDKKSVRVFFFHLLMAKTLLLGFVPFEHIQVFVHSIHLSRVAFTHLILLGIASPFALLLLGKMNRYWIIWTGLAWVMIGFLWLETFHLVSVFGFNFSVQYVYICIGILLLICLIIFLYTSKMISNILYVPFNKLR